MRPTRLFYGWCVVAMAFLVATFAWGFGFYGMPVFLHQLSVMRGWSVATVSGAITVHYLAGAATVIFLSDLHRRLGLAQVTAIGLVLAAVGYAGWVYAPVPQALYAAAVVSGSSWALTGVAGINAIVSPWFERRRPMALSMAYNGASAGGIVIVPAWVALTASVGFRDATVLVSSGTAICLAFVALVVLRPTPASRGVAPDGDPHPPVGPAVHMRAGNDAEPELLSRSVLLRDFGFLTISIAFAVGLTAQVGIVSHLITRLAPSIGAQAAALAISGIVVCAIIGRFLLAALIGGRDRRHAASANFLLQAAGTAFLAFGSDAPVAIALGCACFGLGLGNLISLPPLIAQAEFPRVSVGRVVGLITAINQGVYAFAPAIFGVLRELAGSYTLAFALAAALQVLAALIILLGPSARRRI